MLGARMSPSEVRGGLAEAEAVLGYRWPRCRACGDPVEALCWSFCWSCWQEIRAARRSWHWQLEGVRVRLGFVQIRVRKGRSESR